MTSCLANWIAAVAWIVLIFLGSTDALSAEHTSRFLVPFLRWIDPDISWVAMDTIHTVIRKLGHVSEYAILAVLLWRAIGGGKRSKTRISVLVGLIWGACAILAASDEFHQSFVHSRMPSGHDVIIDAGGAVLGLSICRLFAGRQLIKLEPAAVRR
jgi:VanZ family protein